jgi:hemerythrin-like domain-containing protein
MPSKRTKELKPLSSEHHQALLLAFQLKKGLAGHGDSAGAPKDLAGLLALARRFNDHVLGSHVKAEEELLGQYLSDDHMKRLQAEHGELARLLKAARSGKPSEMRVALASFADLLERHVRWEERELFSKCEGEMTDEALADVGGELERRLVLNKPESTRKRA